MMTRQIDGNPMNITSCMKQHLIVFKPTKNENAVDNGEQDTDLEVFDEEIDQTEQISDFMTVSSFVSLFSGIKIEPFYLVQITGKGVAEQDISDPCRHFVSKGMRYFQGLYFIAVRSRNSRIKEFSTIPARIVMTPDEIYNTYVDINALNTLIRKASC